MSIRHGSPALLALALVVAGGATPAAARTIDREFHESFAVERGAALELIHGDGDVSIEAWDEPRIDVHVRYVAEATRVGLGPTHDFTVEFERRGEDLVVTGRESGRGFTIGYSSISRSTYAYTVRAPSWVALRLRGDDGDVTVAGWRADVDVRIDDGDVRLDDVEAATVEIAADDGDVELLGVRATVAVTSDDGDVTVRNSRIGDARFDLEDGTLRLGECEGDPRIGTDDGDVLIEGLTTARLRVETEDGDVAARLGPRPGFQGEIRTDDGDVLIEGLTTARLRVETEDGDVAARLGPRPGFQGEIRTDDGRVRIEVGPAASLDVDLSSADGDVDVDAPGARFEAERRRATGRIGEGDGRLVVRTDDGDIELTAGGVR